MPISSAVKGKPFYLSWAFMLWIGAPFNVQAQQVGACADAASFSSSGLIAVSDRAVITGSLRSLGNLQLGYDAKVYSHVEVSGNLSMNDRSVISDWAYVGGGVEVSQYAILEKGASAPAPAPCAVLLASPSWNSQATALGDTLRPGAWTSIVVPYGATRYVVPGRYQIANLEIQNEGKLVFLDGETTIFEIQGNLSFGDRSRTVGDFNPVLAKKVQWHYFGTNQIRIGYDALFDGLLVAPNASLAISDRAMLYGGFSVAAVNIGYDTKLYGIKYQSGGSQSPDGLWNPLDSESDNIGYLQSTQNGLYNSSNGALTGSIQAPHGTGIPSKTIPISPAFRKKSFFAFGQMAQSMGRFSSGLPQAEKASQILNFDHPPLSPFSSAGSGEWIQGVNTLTGQYTRSLPLSAVSAPGGISFPLILNYVTPSSSQVGKSIRENPTGPVGYGWNMDFPNIVTQTNGTAYYSDDEIFLNLGPWGGGQLSSMGNGKFVISSNPNILVTPIGDIPSGVITQWEVLLQDSTVLVFGGRPDAIRRGLRRGWKVAQSGTIAERTGSGDFPYRWDITEIRAPHNQGLIRFTWNQVLGSFAGGTPYVRESWPSSIWSLPGGFKVSGGLSQHLQAVHSLDSIQLLWLPKGLNEVLALETRHPIEPWPDPRLTFESRYLDSMEVFGEGASVRNWKLRYNSFSQTNGSRRFLASVTPGLPNGKNDSSWQFSYNHSYDDPNGGGSVTGWLTKIISPTMVQDSLVLAPPVLYNDSWYGADSLQVSYPSGTEQGATDVSWRWGFSEDLSQCRGEFCYFMPRVAFQYNYTEVADKPSPPTNSTPGSLLTVFLKVGSSVKQVLGPQFFPGAIFPGDGFFVALDSTGQAITVYEWDGGKFIQSSPFLGDELRVGVQPAAIYMGNDYFLVEFRRQTSREVVPVIRNSAGQWISLNRNNADCDIRSKTEGIYESNINDAASYTRQSNCLEFSTNRGGPTWGHVVRNNHEQSLLIAAENNFFVIATQKTGVELLVTRWKSGSRFEVEREIRHPERDATKLFAYQLISGPDYYASLCINSTKSLPIVRFVSNWNGESWDRQDVQNWSDLGVIDGYRYPSIYPLSDGFALLTTQGELHRYRKVTGGNGWITTFSTGTLDNNPKHPCRITGSEHLTTLQFNEQIPNGKITTDRPLQLNSTNYYSFVFLRNVDVSDMLIRNASHAPFRLVDVQISPDENWLIGKSIYGGTEANKVLCTSGACNVDIYRVEISKEGSGFPSGSAMNWTKIDSGIIIGAIYGYAPSYVLSGSQWMATKSQGASLASVAFHPMYSSGPRSSGTDGFVVKELITESLFRNSTGRQSVFSKSIFNYSSGLGYIGGVQTSESKRTEVLQKNWSGDTLSRRIHNYWIQGLGAHDHDRIPDSAFKVGRLKSDSIIGRDGSIQISFPKYQNIRRDEWGPAFALLRDTANQSWSQDPTGTHQSFQSLSGRYDQFSMQPQVQMKLFPDNSSVSDAINAEYRHTVSLQLFNTSGMPIESRTMIYRDRESAVELLNKSLVPSLVERIDADVSSGKALPISGRRTVYFSNNFDPFENHVWGYRSGGVDASRVGEGQIVSPTSFEIDADWVKVDSVGLRSITGRPLQTVYVADPSATSSSINVIEGSRGLVTASLNLAWPEEIAVLTAEDGKIGLNGNTWDGFTGQGKWILRPGVTFDSTMSHLGRYSLKVTDSYGPTTNLYLRDRVTLKNGLDISVWVYSTGASLQLNAQIRNSPTGPMTGGWSALVPEEGVVRLGTWQRWVLRISHDQLEAAGALNEENGTVELRVFCGPGPDGPSGRTIWLDNFVVRPSLSKLTLVSFDHLGRPIGAMDGQGRWSTTEYDLRGQVQSVRDDRGRITTQGSLLPSGAP